ncbi:MAG: hypothetical protein QM426_10480 [Euryarchaeota archaeon]|nr:hypothetical protein [Euryarchaeota archaeon]
MKLTTTQIRDLEEYNSEVEEEEGEEMFNETSIQYRYTTIYREAERALRSAPTLTWSEFIKKWGKN